MTGWDVVPACVLGVVQAEGRIRVNRRSPGPDLAAIASAASREAGGVPVGMLGDYLPAAADAAASGRRLTATELAGYGRSGEQAAMSGVALRGLVDLFLSATWRLWRELPVGTSLAAARAAGLAVLRAADDAVAAAAEGFERALLTVARREEGERREFFDDLLSGRGRVGDLLVRGDQLGLRLAGPHQVVVAGPASAGRTVSPAGVEVEAVVADAAAPSPSMSGPKMWPHLDPISPRCGRCPVRMRSSPHPVTATSTSSRATSRRTTASTRIRQRGRPIAC